MLRESKIICFTFKAYLLGFVYFLNDLSVIEFTLIILFIMIKSGSNTSLDSMDGLSVYDNQLDKSSVLEDTLERNGNLFSQVILMQFFSYKQQSLLSAW